MIDSEDTAASLRGLYRSHGESFTTLFIPLLYEVFPILVNDQAISGVKSSAL